MPISPEEKPRRVLVLANVTANGRHCYDDFVKNALPLLHLAGLQVDIVKAESETQLEALASAMDKNDADAVYVVGGDGTIDRVVTGICKNRDKSLPIGVFPGGYDNRTLKRLVPHVFESTSDVRRYCESAMALIEEQKRKVAAFEFSVTDEPESLHYGIGDVGAGWYRKIEDRRQKLWYFGALKRRWAYIWEMVKNSPEIIEADVVYTEACAGCNTCRSATPTQPVVVWRWWHILTGTPRYKQIGEKTKDYSNIVNENCGQAHEVQVRGTDLLIENEQTEEESSRLRLRVGGKPSRFNTISEGMARCSENKVGSSTNPNFYSTDVLANSVTVKFNKMPDSINSLHVSSDERKFEGLTEKPVKMQTTRKLLEFYLPNKLRHDLVNL
ncbi:hypothetical protein WR25_15317 isoform A [Diploscapter pachys]|uniref:DAGKc domain-containing protein n=2 Tax=Diploscapter pachys TaxID=2018661 RepID=A0A2A2KL54_9BILA|nr:hypothetical protein WR25_15317 isoform A [Diploscapter pachys]